MVQDTLKRRVVVSAGPPLERGADWGAEPLQIEISSGNTASCLQRGGTLQELQLYKPLHASWFADSDVISDGALYLCSAVDPLFLAIPLLERSRQQTEESAGMFQDPEEIFRAGGEGGEKLREAAAGHLHLICDSKTNNGDTYFRISEKRVLAWLRCKVHRTVAALQGCMGGFDEMEKTSLEAYVVGLLGEYLSPEWLKRLQVVYHCESPTDDAEAQPLSEAVNQTQQRSTYEQIQNKRKLTRLEMTRQKAKEARDEKKATQRRRESAGMKKMSSFFTAKTKA